jgi:hypothetical protein
LFSGQASPSDQNRAAQVIQAVKHMRERQRAYFACPERPNLMEAKDAEREVDRLVREIDQDDSQGELL